ncbi:MAG: branched-chain amino acid ABC transporter permease [Deltaproteobacteria bacterium]|nr:branched-chain amino acid ABC transporter permease [Deltaproteobacteria bacterium]
MQLSPSLVLAQMLNGVAFGMLLFLVAAGLSLIFGLMGTVNLAHGSYFMVGGYLGLTVLEATESFLLALAAGAAGGALLGLLTERFLIRRVRGLAGHESILLTFALALVLSDLSLFLWSGTPRWVQAPEALASPVTVFGRPYPAYRLMLIGLGAVVFVGLYWFQERTLWGAIVRAGVDDKETATGLGINIPLVFTTVFAVGALLAGFGGFVGAPILGLHVGLDLEVIMLALAVVIVGGLGSLGGCLATCLLLGVSDTLGKMLWPSYASLTIYLLVVIVLLVKPSGLFGRAAA